MSTDGWAQQVPLGEVVRHRKEFIEIDDFTKYKRCRVQLHAKGILLRDEVEGAAIKTKKQQVCRPDEFLVAEIDAKVGGFGLVPKELDGAIVSSHYFLFDAIRDRLDPRFLGFYCRTHAFRDQVTARGTTNYAAIRPAHVLDYTIPLPPIAEQRRIVAKIERLAGKIAEARELSTAVDKLCHALEASMGSAMFESIASCAEGSILLGDASEVRSGVTLGRDLTGDLIELPYLRVANVQDGRLDLAQIKTVWIKREEHAKWQLHEDDLLLTEGGDWDKLGRGTIWKNEIADCIHQNHIFRVRITDQRLSPDYVLAVIRSPFGKAYFQNASKKTTNLASINQRQLKAFPIPLVSPIKQREAVRRLNADSSRIAEASRGRDSVSKHLAACLPSILDRAFNGRLSTDGDDSGITALTANLQLAKRAMVYTVMLLRHWNAPVARNAFDACLALMLNDQARKKILGDGSFETSSETTSHSPLRGLDNLLGEMRVRKAVKVTTRKGQQFLELGQQPPSTDNAPSADKTRLKETIAAFEVVGEDRAADMLAEMIDTTYELAAT